MPSSAGRSVPAYRNDTSTRSTAPRSFAGTGRGSAGGSTDVGVRSSSAMRRSPTRACWYPSNTPDSCCTGEKNRFRYSMNASSTPGVSEASATRTAPTASTAACATPASSATNGKYVAT